MTDAGAPPGLLLLAHGERIDDPDNEGVRHLLAELRRREILPEIQAGLLAGHPGVGEAIRAFKTSRVLVYPLFMADGYFLRKARALLNSVAQERQVAIEQLPPLGTSAGLADAIAKRAQAAACAQGLQEAATRLVLIAHGSQRERASQAAADALVRDLQARDVFASVHDAFLEQPPPFSEVIGASVIPAVAIGLFMGSGLHGGEDVDRLLSASGSSVTYAGNVGTWPEIADLVAEDIRRHIVSSPASRPAAC